MVLKETLVRISNMTTPTNEQATITQIIVPVLIDLGWDVDTISREHWVGGRKEGGKVDIALMKGNRCVCIVEAKRPGINLMDHVDQVLRYAFYEGVTFCILTDGLEWRFYLPREEGRPEEREFAVIRLKDNLIEQSENDLRRFLSREAILSGAAEHDAVRKLNELQIDRELPNIWREMLSEPDQELVTWVERRVFEKHGFSPSADQVAKVIVATAAPNQPTYSSSPASPHHVLTTSREQTAREGRKRIDYTLFGVYKSRSGIGMWADVVEQMCSRHERDFLERAEELRLTPGSRRVLISRNSHSINRSKGLNCRNGQRIYIEYSLTQAECVNLAYQLLKLFGYPSSDLEIHEGAEPALTVSSPARQRSVVGATLFGTDRSLRSAIELLDFVAVQLYERHGQDLLDKVAQISGRKIQISRDPMDIDRPRETGAPGIFIDRNLTIAGIKARSYEWLRLFGYPDSALQIHER